MGENEGDGGVSVCVWDWAIVNLLCITVCEGAPFYKLSFSCILLHINLCPSTFKCSNIYNPIYRIHFSLFKTYFIHASLV